MRNEFHERRRAPRYPIQVKAVVRTSSGAAILATSIDISSNGVMLYMDQTSPLALGEEVTVDLELRSESGQALSSWAIGKVVRTDGKGAAIQLCAGKFDDSCPQEGEASPDRIP